MTQFDALIRALRRPTARRPRRWLVDRVLTLLTAVILVGGNVLASGYAPPPPAADDGGPAARPAGAAAVPTGARPDVGSLAAPGAAGRDPAGAAAGALEPALQPTVQYEDALAHANDRIQFAPGGPARVPFRPRPDDTWPTDDVAGPADTVAGVASGATGLDAAPRATLARLTSTGAADAARRPRRQVFGFLPYWELASSTTRIDDSLLTTIAYFSVGADASGNLLRTSRDGSPTVGWAGWTSARLTRVIDRAHAAGTRVVLTVSVFAWSSRGAATQRALLGDPRARLRLARQIAAAVHARGADGVNLDFEPLVAGASDEFTAFVRTLRKQLDRVKRGYQLTFDTTPAIGNYPIEAATAKGGADAIFVMGYDYRAADSARTGSIAPIAGPGSDVTDTVLAYLDRVPASRIILGVPWYGRAWSTAGDGPNARTLSGPAAVPSASVPYATAVAYIEAHGRRWDAQEQVAWTAYRRRACAGAGCAAGWRELYVDDAAALGAKLDLVNRLGLRGVGIWALGYDGSRPELAATLAARITRDTTAPQAAVDVLPATATDEGFVVTWTATDDTAVERIDVQVSIDGGPWRAWLIGTGTSSDVYPGRDGHRYAFRVRARDVHGNWSTWSATSPTVRVRLATGAFATVVRGGLAVRTAPGTAATFVRALDAGAVLAVTAGPVRADGYSWYRVTGPLSSWPPVAFGAVVGGWVAAAGHGQAFLAPRSAPNAVSVHAAITGLSFGGAGAASLGRGGTAARSFSPNGDGHADRLRIDWTNRRTFDHLALLVRTADGRLVGTVQLDTRRSAGRHRFDWAGVVGSRRLPRGTYVVQLVGSVGRRQFSAPSARPVTPAQLARFAVTIR